MHQETKTQRHQRLAKRINHIEDNCVDEYYLYFLCGKTSEDLDQEKEYFVLFNNVKFTNKILCTKCKNIYDLMIFK